MRQKRCKAPLYSSCMFQPALFLCFYHHDTVFLREEQIHARSLVIAKDLIILKTSETSRVFKDELVLVKEYDICA